MKQISLCKHPAGDAIPRVFPESLGVSPKTVEAWENGRNKPEGASRRLLEIVRDNPQFPKTLPGRINGLTLPQGCL